MAHYLANFSIRIGDGAEASLMHDVTTEDVTPGQLLDVLIAEVTDRNPDAEQSVTLALTLTAI